MGSPLGTTLANVFICQFEKLLLENCSTQFKRVVYKRYVNNTFLIFRSTEHAEKFEKYFNRTHKNIAFTSEIEQSGSCHFWALKSTVRTANLSLQFTESLHIV